MIGQNLSQYRVVEKIGAGGMGVVYRARDERLQRDIAVKVLPAGSLTDQDSRRRLRKEAMALSRLNHPNIATIYDFNTERGVDFLAMEYISGVTLTEKLRSGPVPETDAVRLGVQAAAALEAAHEQGLIHRDLKPANIMVTSKGLVKVLDFGLAKLFRPTESEATATLTETGTESLSGTLPYMAPEQLQSGGVDERTDIHALGAVLYELVTGRRLFPQKAPSDIVQAIIAHQPPPPRSVSADISEGLQRIILKCTEKDPARRYASARELGRDLNRLEAGELPAESASAGTSWRPRQKRMAIVVVAAAMAVALLVVALKVGGLKWQATGNRPGANPVAQSVAVLPLQNLSENPKEDYFAEGITDSLITELGQISTMRVISRTSVQRYRKTEKSLPDIAKELKVDMVVEGSVLRAGGRVRITAKLINPSGERQLWAQAYERDVGDTLSLQSEIARDIARRIGIRLSEEARLQFVKSKPVNLQALDAYLKGVYSGESSHFEQAVRIEPDFALAYTKIASGYFYSGLFGEMPPRDAFLKMKEAALTALRKDDTLGEAHGYLAVGYLHSDLNWPEADKEFKRAFELNPSLAMIHHLYAHYLMAMNRMDESMSEVKVAEQLDPFSWDQSQCFGWHCLFAKGYDEAIDLAHKGLQSAPQNAWAQVILGWSYEQKSMLKESIAEFENALATWKDNSLPLAGLGHAYGISGRREEAHRVLEKLLAMSKQRYIPAYDIAVVYMGLGDKAEAIHWLSKACDERSGFLVYIKCDRRFDGLRSEPGYVDLLKRIGLPVAALS